MGRREEKNRKGAVNFLGKNSDMASFCGAESNTFTDAELTADHGPGLIASANLGNAGRESDGLLTQAAASTAVQTLTTAGLIPVPPTSTTTQGQDTGMPGSESSRIEAFMKKDRTFVEGIKHEYCFYDARYKYALRQLIQLLQAGYSDTNSKNQALIQKYLKFTQVLNRKLNDLSQITNTVTQTRIQQTQDSGTSINSVNAQMAERSKLLQHQNKILSTDQGATNLYKDMVGYTREKVNYTNNMLAMYSFMNITALGLLFYLYTAMRE